MISTLDVIKLALGLAAFVFIVVVGGRNKRITGALLTFPVMNGVALLTSPDPFRVADAIALLVVFNTLLFWVAVMTLPWVPPKPERFAPLALLVCRVLVWTAVWCIAAYWLTDNRDRFPSGMILFALQLVFAVGAASLLWSRTARHGTKGFDTDIDVRLAKLDDPYRPVSHRLRGTALHSATCFGSEMDRNGQRAPIIGFFGLAYLSTQNTEAQLLPIRDTVLLDHYW